MAWYNQCLMDSGDALFSTVRNVCRFLKGFPLYNDVQLSTRTQHKYTHTFHVINLIPYVCLHLHEHYYIVHFELFQCKNIIGKINKKEIEM